MECTEKGITQERQRLNQKKNNNAKNQPGAAGLMMWAWEFTLITGGVSELLLSSPPEAVLALKMPFVMVHAEVAFLHVSALAFVSLYTAQSDETVTVLSFVGGPIE